MHICSKKLHLGDLHISILVKEMILVIIFGKKNPTKQGFLKSLKKSTTNSITWKNIHSHTTQFKKDPITDVFYEHTVTIKGFEMSSKRTSMRLWPLIANIWIFYLNSTWYHKQDTFHVKNGEKTGYNNDLCTAFCDNALLLKRMLIDYGAPRLLGKIALFIKSNMALCIK